MVYSNPRHVNSMKTRRSPVVKTDDSTANNSGTVLSYHYLLRQITILQRSLYALRKCLHASPRFKGIMSIDYMDVDLLQTSVVIQYSGHETDGACQAAGVAVYLEVKLQRNTWIFRVSRRPSFDKVSRTGLGKEISFRFSMQIVYWARELSFDALR